MEGWAVVQNVGNEYQSLDVEGAWLGLRTKIIGVVYFWKARLLNFFLINQGVSQGCTLSPTLVFIYINGLLNVIEKCPEL